MPYIDRKRAEKIAGNFLQQYHSTVTIESAFLENEIWIVAAKIGLVNKQIRRISIDANSGQILSYTDREITNKNQIIKKSIISLSIEKALRRIGDPTYEKVIQKLYGDHHCYLPDCYEYPEYLNKVLKELFGSNYKDIVEAIKANLKDVAEQKSVTDFLTAISE
ncbi:MAG TPA: hypothetical protein VGR54_04630 [Nitrosopumilaceae archaeon]|nr:hypothetical protein [Nitrosopumilaceae archaeon]